MNGSETCVLCKNEYRGHGNNPAPVVQEGRCCDDCNSTRVIPARLKQLEARLHALEEESE